MAYLPLSVTIPKSKRTLVDFGTTSVSEKTFTIVDPDTTTLSNLTGNVFLLATADHSLDEVQEEAFDLKFGPGTGSLTLFIRALLGVVYGKYYVSYTVSGG